MREVLPILGAGQSCDHHGFRDVFAEVVSGHLGADNLQSVFPGFHIDRARFAGVLG
ncbi:MAG: hypothetical protein KAJ67_04725 [Gemmatimonadetes bacterium]|nr:hypothetical protein [Gemmatimonadota bacterium]